MANPQPDKFTRISNELLEAIYRYPFNSNEIRVMLFILRNTYGYQRKVLKLRKVEIAKDTGIGKNNIDRVLNSLKFSTCIICSQVEDKPGISIGIQKDYEKWKKRTKKYKKVLKLSTKSSQVEEAHLIYKRKKKESAKRKPLTEAPSEFPITEKMRAYAKHKNYIGDLELMTEKFLKRHKAKGDKFRDWYKAWQTWLLNDIEYFPHKVNNLTRNKSDPFFNDQFLKTAHKYLTVPGYSEDDFNIHCRAFKKDPGEIRKIIKEVLK